MSPSLECTAQCAQYEQRSEFEPPRSSTHQYHRYFHSIFQRPTCRDQIPVWHEDCFLLSQSTTTDALTTADAEQADAYGHRKAILPGQLGAVVSASRLPTMVPHAGRHWWTGRQRIRLRDRQGTNSSQRRDDGRMRARKTSRRAPAIESRIPALVSRMCWRCRTVAMARLAAGFGNTEIQRA